MQKFSFGKKAITVSALTLTALATAAPAANAYPTDWWKYNPAESRTATPTPTPSKSASTPKATATSPSWSDSPAAQPRFAPVARTVNPVETTTRVANSSSSTADRDGDGIPDTWEANGYDADGDGRADLDFPTWGANPNKKDLFVEMDYMPGLMASQSELDDVVRTFANYPVSNPDGSKGINIHLDAGDIYPKYDLGGGNEIPYQTLRNEQSVVQLRQSNSDPARQDIFHYMVFGDYYTDAPGSSGIAQIDGLNFAVTLGPTYWGNNVSSNTYTGTFIHELGHNLGLLHGGDDDVNFKPNYFSIMNYRYQIQGVPRTDGSKYFGYSTKEYRTIDEGEVYEEDGLGPESRGFLYAYRSNAVADAPIDFNDNGDIDNQPVEADLNDDGYIGYLTAQNDLKAMRFQAHPNRGYRYSMERPEVANNELTADMAREHGLLD